MVFMYLLKAVGFMVPVLVSVAFLTLVERKVLGYMQLRKGPNMVGPFGLLQPIADGLKLFMKETLKPSVASPYLFFFSPALFLGVVLILWCFLPLGYSVLEVDFSVLLVMGLSSLCVYSFLGSGWSSNSKYSFLGAVRAVAQTVSYEMSLGVVFFILVLFCGGYSFMVVRSSQEVVWLFLGCLPVFLVWFVSTLAETNRAPFDLTEGESEMVSGYKVEYAGGPFAMFFMSEYASIMFMNLLSSLLFFGGGSPFVGIFPLDMFLVSLECGFLVVLFLWVRASYPRFRYDQLMYLTWKSYLPFVFGFFLFLVVLMIFFCLTPGGYML